jgi:hypothetical protein
MSAIRHPARTARTSTSPPGDIEAEVKRLVDLVATETGHDQAGPDFQWVVLADPDGNAFCVAGGDVEDAT